MNKCRNCTAYKPCASLNDCIRGLTLPQLAANAVHLFGKVSKLDISEKDQDVLISNVVTLVQAGEISEGELIRKLF